MLCYPGGRPVWAINHHSGISQLCASFQWHSVNIFPLFAVTLPSWTCAVGDRPKQIPDTRTGLGETRALPFKSSRKDLQWNYSGCFLSAQRLWEGGAVPASPPLARGGIFIENCSRVWERTEQLVWWAVDWLIDVLVCQGAAKAVQVLH